MNGRLRFIGVLFWWIFLMGKAFSQADSTYKDSASLPAQEAVNKLSGQLRYFFMATDNQHPLTDYFAHAIGLQLKYERGPGRHFRFAAGASAAYKISSSDLSGMDTLAKKSNRYEVQLFDLRYPGKKAIYRLEELYGQYVFNNGFIRLGSQLINTPFINPQDGRMRPTFVSGLFTSLSFSSMKIEGGWIAGMLPRSIGGWYTIGSSIGLNPQGINTDGTISNYGGHLTSNGIFLAGLTRTISPGIKLKLWEQYVDKIFNTALLQVDIGYTLSDKAKILSSLQYTNQVKIGNGGNSESSKGYFTSGTPAQVISTMAGIASERFEASLNYTRIGKGARFLMPREWGREPFFTFMPRERNEGFGDVQAFVFKTAYKFPGYGLNISLQAGHFKLPDVKNVALNKYGMPSYNQLNAELRYAPRVVPKLDLQFLYVYKDNRGGSYQNPGYVFNKVNMALYNVVVNYNL